MMQIRKTIPALSLLLLALTALLLSGCGAADKSQAVSWGRADAKEIDINSKISGRVVELLVKEGDTVKAGDVIARIDRRSLDAQRLQAEAAIKNIEAQQLQAGVVTTMQSGTTASTVGQARAALDKAQSDLSLAQADYVRYRDLLADGAVSQQTYDQYATRYETAQAAANQAQAAVDEAASGTMQVSADKAKEEALAKQLEQAQAALQEVDVNLDETEIRAPFDGVITEKYIEEGSMISTGTPLVAIQDPTDNWVDIKVPETQLKDFSLGQEVELIGRDGETRVTGTVTDISKKAEFATQRATSERADASDIISFNVKIQVNSPALWPGMRFRLATAGEKS